MANPIYELTEDGTTFNVIDLRRATYSVSMPRFLYDLYLPIIKFTGIGFLGTLYCMTSYDESHVTLHNYCTAGGVGFEKLKKFLDLFEYLKLIRVDIRTGEEKVKHFNTRIYLLDPPMNIPEEYVELVKNNAIPDWYFKYGGEPTPQPEPVVQQQMFAPLEPPKKERKKRDETVIDKIIKTYKSLLSVPMLAAFNEGMERKGAKSFETYANRIGWDVDTTCLVVKLCYAWALDDRIWGDKLSLVVLHNRFLARWVMNNPGFNPSISPPIEETPTLPLHPDWKNVGPNHPDFWKVGTRLPYEDGTMVVTIDVDGSLIYIHEQTNEVIFTKE